MGYVRQLQRLSLVVATAFLVLTLGVVSASAAARAKNSARACTLASARHRGQAQAVPS